MKFYFFLKLKIKDSKDAFSLMKSNKVYYNLTHTIKEKIEK